jgi:hypothetical protein
MTSRDFCYWLQGFFELTAQSEGLTAEQDKSVRAHLAMVFKHEIDPAMGDAAHQKILSEIHNSAKDQQKFQPFDPHTTKIMC